MIEASVLHDRIRGSLLGAAIGDALGSAFEFVGSSAIERAIGSNVATEYLPAIPRSLLAPRGPGIPTDDTAMTLALVEALVEGDPRSPAALLSGMAERLRREDGPVADMFWNGGPGGAPLSVRRKK
jgi:ADP-ribosylglycohydrolase